MNFDAPVIVADPTPPPISGGTLLVSSDGQTAVVSDPDRDQVVVVDLNMPRVIGTVPLEPGDQPGRLAQDASGRVHVVLRGSGSLGTIDPGVPALTARQAICAEPRGIAYEPQTDSLEVACAEGALLRVPASGGVPTRRITLERDLRDVVVDRDTLWVSTFRSAAVLHIDATGESTRMVASDFPTFDGTRSPEVAWRMVRAQAGGVLVVHQLAANAEVVIQPGGYGSGGCGSLVESAVTLFRDNQLPQTQPLSFTQPLPVDLADAADGTVAVAFAGVSLPGSQGFMSLVQVQDLEGQLANAFSFGDCGPVSAPPVDPGSAQVVAVAFAGSALVVQTREPSQLIVGERAVVLPGSSRADTGHTLFHGTTGAGIACASCHPEGREDGHVWHFQAMGPRRTQAIEGGILDTAPFHWNGEMSDFRTLEQQVMEQRMLGPSLSDAHVAALADWIDRIPALKAAPIADAAAVERGRALFTDAAVGCGTCHSGVTLTDNATVDVGTGGLFQVPSLRGVAWRAPFMHDGCATTLDQRFTSCGGNKHGNTASLSPAQVGDLVSFLETL